MSSYLAVRFEQQPSYNEPKQWHSCARCCARRHCPLRAASPESCTDPASAVHLTTLPH